MIYLLFAVPQCPHLKKRYHDHVEKVKEYLETIKDFDKLQLLFLHFLGPKPSSKVRKNLEVVKKNECSIFSLFIFIFIFYSFSFLSGMTTRFSKQKLAKAQEKKAKGGLISGLLSKKRLKTSNASKDDPIMTPPFAHSPAKRPTFPTSSLEVIAYIVEETKKEKKVVGKSFLPTFWDDANAAALKAHKALSVDDLSPLMAKSSSEVMSSHIQKLVQVYFDNVGCFFFFVLHFLREIFFICRLLGSPCSSLRSFWIWRRGWPRLSL